MIAAPGASARRCAAWPAVQVVTHWQSKSFSRSSQAGVVQMSLACAERHQRATGQRGGIARDRRRRVRIVGVDDADIRRHLGGQHQGLAEAADPVGGTIAPQVRKPRGPGRAVAWRAPHPPPGAQHAQRLLIQILRQIEHGRRDLAMQRVHGGIGRVAQRHDQQRQAAALERQQLLRDEGLGQARPALDHDGDALRAHAPSCGSSATPSTKQQPSTSRGAGRRQERA